MTEIHDSIDLSHLFNTSVPASEEDAAETPRDWLDGLWVAGEVYALDPDATTETCAVLAVGTAAVKHSPRGAYCGGHHRTAVESIADHWCPADVEEWADGEARGVTRDWRTVYVWDANGYSDTTTHATIHLAKDAFAREVAELEATGEYLRIAENA